MEAAARTRQLTGERAQRIVDAMRASVALRGAAGSTFDHVAREAGVSRGLLHYYFGTKERLLVEVVRRDTDIWLATLDAALADAHTADDFIEALVRSLEDMVEHDFGFVTFVFELFTAAQRNEEICTEVAELYRRTLCGIRRSPAWLAGQSRGTRSRGRPRMQGFMLKLDGVLCRRRWLVFAVWAALLVAAFLLAMRQSDHLRGGGFDVPGSPSKA